MNTLRVLKQEIFDLSRGARGRVLLVISYGWFLLIGAQMIYPVLLPHLREAHGLSLTLAGFLITTIWLAQAVGQIPGGLLADRIGSGTVLMVSTGVSAVGLTLVVVVESRIAVFVATGVFGLGIALFGIARFSALYALFPDRVGVATGVVNAAADAGQTVLPPVASVVAFSLAWQFGLGFTIPFIVILGFWIKLDVPLREPGSEVRPAVGVAFKENLSILTREFRRPRIVNGTLILVIYAMIWAAFTGFYPTYLIEIKGLSPTVAGGVFASFFGAGIAVKPIAGEIYDRTGIRLSIALVGVAGAVAFAALPFVGGVVPLLVVTLLAAPLLGSGTIVQPYMIEEFPREMEGTGLAAVRTMFLAIGSFSPLVFGAIADRGLFDEMYVILAVLSGLNVVLAVRIPER